MASLIISLIIAVVIVIVLFVAIDYFAGALGGDGRLWLALKGLIVLAALFIVLSREGILV